MKVLIVAGGYLPGFKLGGPVRSIAALVEHLGNEIDFSIVTYGADLGESEPYSGVKMDSWTRVGKADVWYTMERRIAPWFWRRVVAERDPDVVCLNSFMDPVSSAYLLWRKAGLIPQTPVIVAPRGEFAPSALRIKSLKKAVFRKIAACFRLHQGVIWQATAKPEEMDIRREQPNATRVVLAPDLTVPSERDTEILVKCPGQSRFIWIGRIARVKNVEGIFGALNTTFAGEAHLELYGPVEDEEYWYECLEAAASLPENVHFEYLGQVSHDGVTTALQKGHYFISPSRGEAFGHTIAEALDQGLPVIVSDKTPWLGLVKAGVGWDISLDDSDHWKSVIRQCIAMEDSEYKAMSDRSRKYVAKWMDENGGRQANLEMLHLAKRSFST